MIFLVIRTSIAKEPYIFVIFQEGDPIVAIGVLRNTGIDPFQMQLEPSQSLRYSREVRMALSEIH